MKRKAQLAKSLPTKSMLTLSSRGVLRRLDYRFAPLFCALYFMAYLDRSNIGNAYIAGMRDELGLSGAQFSTAVSVFFATYVAFMVPFVLALKKLKTHRAIAVMAFAWSIVTIGTAFIKSYSGLLACRILLGVCESGFFPCISLYITMVYNRHKQGLRFSYLFAATAFSGMFGGLVATGITKIGNFGGLQSWSWLYIIEGLISLTVVPWAWFGLPEYPAKAKWWTPEQRDTMERRELKRQEYMGTEARGPISQYGLRGSILLFLDTFAVAGYAILLSVSNSSVRYFACFLIALPLYCGPGLNEMWIVNNTTPHYRRATALGISQAVGNVAGVLAGQVYRKAPYMLGHWSSLASAVICMVLISVQIVHFKMENNKKDQISRGSVQMIDPL
ncbi:putative transporter like protein [Verticillium longisporum]|nr:putative transporter like protein [Verticillium longisporum]